MDRNSYDHEIIELNHLIEIVNYISKSKKIEDISKIVFDFINELVDYDLAVIYTLKEETDELEVLACRGANINNLKSRINIKVGEGSVGWVAKEKKTLIINDVLNSNEFKVRQYLSEDPLIASFVSVPLIVDNKLIGILSISSSKKNEFKTKDIQMISIIASQSAVLLELNNEVNKSKRLSNHLLNDVNSGVIVFSNEKRLKLINKKAEKIIGYRLEELENKKIKELPFLNHENKNKLLKKYGKDISHIEKKIRILNKSGKHLEIKYNLSTLYDDRIGFAGYIIIFIDNTENEKLKEQIIRAEKMSAIGKVTSGITHEVRNPLLPIMTASEFLLKNSKIENNYKELLEIIYKESKRLNEFLDNLSVIDNKKHQKTDNKSYILHNLEETLTLLNPLLIKNNIVIEINSSLKKDILVSLSNDETKQVFLNLILNSVEAIMEKREYFETNNIITISVKLEGKKCYIEIVDRGYNLKLDSKEIFDPFYSTKINGTGLGLTVVNNLLMEAGGKIDLEFKKNVYTKFIIEMFAVEEDK